ncbi:DMT family transporter [Calidifontimicrobium sp. SYSU G02091]|uniref:DMT family transporter n=1 Tax=Calidifontimicrobium sp. SYSU G02091 TaxID=2926421 RepID=UPI001F532C7F|nr:DMT family transporter [Calidifontimicrobium sp. SYSU G02091]MCI1191858.1 DMT family transporter [Calidifontimicrobium sp. SYSU G02091]
MTHRRAVALMVLVTLLWSIAGVVTRLLDAAAAFEVTFWRSAFNALALAVLLSWLRGPRALLHTLRTGGPALWLSGLCWSVMFTAFMVALTLTTVANVLVTMAVAPLFTALAARAALGHRLAARTWAAIAVAGAGIAWMYGRDVSAAGGTHGLGVAVALGVPVAAAVNWTLLQGLRQRAQGDAAPPPDMLPAVLVGAVLSAAATLPLSLPFAATAHDVGWLALLGVVQLAVPCLLAVAAARVLSAPEVSLLALLEVVFGVAWAWLGAGEAPSSTVLAGGALVLGALVVHELLALRRPASAAGDTAAARTGFSRGEEGARGADSVP